MIEMIEIEDIEKAQEEWGQGIVSISAAHNSGKDYIERASSHIESLYAYEISPVLFKPTLATEQQFRPSVEGALSYFVGGNDSFPEDKGFAIKDWINVRFENNNYFIYEKTALVMGNYFFMTPDRDEVKVEFSFGYIVDSSGNLRINLHHSSIPAMTDE